MHLKLYLFFSSQDSEVRNCKTEQIAPTQGLWLMNKFALANPIPDGWHKVRVTARDLVGFTRSFRTALKLYICAQPLNLLLSKFAPMYINLRPSL